MTLKLDPSPFNLPIPGQTCVVYDDRFEEHDRNQTQIVAKSWPISHDVNRPLVTKGNVFSPDVGGIYVLADAFNGSINLSVDVPSACRIAVTSDVGLLVHVQGGIVARVTSSGINSFGVSPALFLTTTPPSYATKLALQDSRVLGAVNALVGLSAAQVTASGLPALQAAWTAALAAPSAPASENAGGAALAAAGWNVT